MKQSKNEENISINVKNDLTFERLLKHVTFSSSMKQSKNEENSNAFNKSNVKNDLTFESLIKT